AEFESPTGHEPLESFDEQAQHLVDVDDDQRATFNEGQAFGLRCRIFNEFRDGICSGAYFATNAGLRISVRATSTRPESASRAGAAEHRRDPDGQEGPHRRG